MIKMEQTSLKPENSMLKISPVVFDKISFERLGFCNKDANVQTEFKLSYSVKELGENDFCVTLGATATRKEEYVAAVTISGYCEIDSGFSDNEERKSLLTQNAIAILFPYIRSEMTLLTAQPEVEPIVWPVMNILAMMEQAKEEGNE